MTIDGNSTFDEIDRQKILLHCADEGILEAYA
jgi:hypothetical protein